MSTETEPLTATEGPWLPSRRREEFRWQIPGTFNIGRACAEVHDPASPAIIEDRGDAAPVVTTFGDLADRARRLVTFLRSRGVRDGDRVAIMCPQSAETAIAHLAVYRMGAIAVPLSVKFGPEAVAYRITHSQAVAAIVDRDCLDHVADGLESAEDLHTILVADDELEGTPTGSSADGVGAGADRDGAGAVRTPFTAINACEPATDLPETEPDDPALLIYTSGTTGQPKGALHGHRVVLGHLPGVRRALDGFPAADDVCWTPADWAWAGGLLDVLLPVLYYGRPVVACTAKPTPETVARLLRTHRVTSSFLPPTILKQLRTSDVDVSGTALRAVCSGGEQLGASVAAWARDELEVDIHEIYGQTEINLVIGSYPTDTPSPPGSMGTPTPGFDITLLDPLGEPVPDGEPGEVCVRLPSPNAFLGYWRQPEKTAEKTADGVVHTGDLAVRDAEGFYWFAGRNDDVISSAGYRVGPGEIEEQIIRHESVEMVAVIGVPDDLRGEEIVAVVVPTAGTDGTEALAEEIRESVKTRLAYYQYPRRIEFVDHLPTRPSS